MYPSTQHFNQFSAVQMNPATQKRVADDLELSEVREVKRVKMGSRAIWNDTDFTPVDGFDKYGRQKFKCSFDREVILPVSYVGHIRSQKHKDAKEANNRSFPVRSPTPDAFQMHFKEHSWQRDGDAQPSSMSSGLATPNAIENMQISPPADVVMQSWETASFSDPIAHPVSSSYQSPETMVTEAAEHLDSDSPFKDVQDAEFLAWLRAPDPDEQSQETASSPEFATHVPPQLPEVMVTMAAEEPDLSSTFTELEDLYLDSWLDQGIGAALPSEGDIIDITAASASSVFMTTNVPISPPADEVSLPSEEGPFAGLPAYLLSIPRDVLEELPYFIVEVPSPSSRCPRSPDNEI